MEKYVLGMEKITKYIYDAKGRPLKGDNVPLILKDVDFNLKKGEVHVLLGENGAGKSTLVRILGGIIPQDSGTIRLNGEEVRFKGPRDARDRGVGFIHQELNLCSNLDVAHNIFLGREVQARTGLMREKEMYAESKKLLDSLGFSIPVQMRLGRLSTAQQQVVEIAKALSYQSSILIMDEPTASLTSQEIDMLFRLVEDMREKGMAIIYISHRMEEIARLADRITVLRDGAYIGTMERSEFTVDKAIQMMAGRTLNQMYSCTHTPGDRRMLEVEGLRIGRDTEPITLHVNAGEIVGLGGLVGAGRTELAQSIFGARESYGGWVKIAGQTVGRRSPYLSVKSNVAYLSEDRKVEGLSIFQSIRENIVSASLFKWFNHWFLSRRKEAQISAEMIDQFKVICTSMEQKVSTLSGGNQQRVCFGKWFATKAKVIILDEPTRGIDVNAKAQIYQIMDEAARNGVAILMISSEMPELIGMSDRLYIMRDGNLVIEIDKKEDMDPEKLLEYTIGAKASS